MSDQPFTIVREAKGFHASIKELLKTKEPFDKEIDFQRKNLRRFYLRLLLVHPYAKESEGAETHLWMQTSYAFISDYKQRLTRIDRTAQRPQQGQQQSNQSRHGAVEHRKLLQRFRQFLADEEKFWTQFILRYRRSFSLDEAHPVLVNLGILSDAPDAPADIPPSNGRNHFQFPPEASDPFAPTTSADRECRMTILSKALVCLGDIARYREQYNESGGRSRIGPDDGGRRRNRRGGGPPTNDSPRPRNYEKARACYEQAKLLTPHDGNPSHQLAIIASYENDLLASLVHYYRSLCVKHPYDTASDNMGTLLKKAWARSKAPSNNPVPPELAQVPKVVIDEFKKKVVLLHASWQLGLKSKDSLTLKEAKDVYHKFYVLVSDRHLPEDFITQIIILAQGALWKVRMTHEKPSHSSSRDRTESSTLASTVIEARIYTHFLSLYRALLEVGIEKLKEAPPVDSEDDLAQRLIVEFRRTLPALRIAGKWLKANFKYVMSDPEALGTGAKSSSNTEEDHDTTTISSLSLETIEFWGKFAEFLRALSRAFPYDRLPDLSFPLSEDIEMRGFRPLKGSFDSKKDSTGENDDVPHQETEVHPNDVQLMRIKDLIKDAKSLVKLENSPLALYGNQFVLRGVESQVQPIPSNASALPEVDDEPIDLVSSVLSRGALPAGAELEEDAMTEVTSKTDDDVLRDAFGHLNEDEDEDDEIVWDPRASPVAQPGSLTPGLIAPRSPVAPTTPIKAPVSPIGPIAQPQSQLVIPSAPRVAPTTAEDLLKGFMSAGRPTDLPKGSRTSSDPLIQRAPAILFGGDRAGNSIWSASQDEEALRFSTTGNPEGPSPTAPQLRHRSISGSQDLSQQSIWSYSSQNSQHNLIGALPSATFAPAPHPAISNLGHHRVPSASIDPPLYPTTLTGNIGFGPPGGQHLAQHMDPRVNMLNASYLNAHPPFDTLPGNLYGSHGNPQIHNGEFSFHAPPPVSSIWANPG